MFLYLLWKSKEQEGNMIQGKSHMLILQGRGWYPVRFCSRCFVHSVVISHLFPLRVYRGAAKILEWFRLGCAEVTRIAQCLFFGWGGSARACVLELQTEVGRPELGLGMVGFEWTYCSKLDNFRGYHIYVLWTSVWTRMNSVILIGTCTTSVGGMNLYLFWNTHKMEKGIMLEYNWNLRTNGNT